MMGLGAAAAVEEPLLQACKVGKHSQRYSREELALVCLLFAGKLVCGLAQQSILVFAPFLAEDAGGLSLAEYRLGLLAADLASVLPALLPLDGASPRVLGAASMLALAAALLAPQGLPAHRRLPLAQAACRFLAGCAWTGYGIVSGAVLSTFARERRTMAIAWVEMSWFVASFGVPVFGVLLDASGVTAAIEALLVAPAVLLAVASAWLLPTSLGEAAGCGPSGGCAPPRHSKASVARRMAGVLARNCLASSCCATFQCRYGGWLHAVLGMSASDLGWFSNAIGVGNLTGNLLTQLIGTGMASVRSMAILTGVALSCINVALALTPPSAPAGLLFVLVFFYFLVFETGFLTSYSYATQLLGPSEQLTGMSLFFASYSVGRVAGDWLAPLPVMTALFAGSAATYLLASGALAATPDRGPASQAVAQQERRQPPRPEGGAAPAGA